MDVSLVSSVTPELETLWEHAHKDVIVKRGGVALLKTLCGAIQEGDLLEYVVASSSLWVVHDDAQLVGFVVCRDQVVEAIYVANPHRRKKAATTLVRALLTTSTPPLDAYALPGDRAMKSLYESLGWKARLLTMRGA
ncbi:MAG TPA: GNAT family N-acetyltransferase [Acidimicrobiales bacterium]|nr:GNAT family N-acetyltransferase [Acidimicrobiales bacterium]